MNFSITNSDFVRKLILLSILSLLLAFLVFSVNFAFSSNPAKGFSTDYFERGVLGSSRLLSLDISDLKKAQAKAFYEGLFSDGSQTLLVLIYHSFYRSGTDFKTPYSISVDDFKDELSTLLELQFEPVSMKQVFYYVKFGMRIPARAVLLTFDDGFKTFNYVYPIVKEYGFKGVISVMTGFTQSSWSVSASEISEIYKDGFIDVASHTHILHNDFKKAIEKKNYAAINEDIKKSREFLNSLGVDSYVFALPWGSGAYDINFRAILQQHGFKAALATWKERHIKPLSDPFVISRVEVSERGGFSKKDQFKKFLMEYLEN